MTIEEGDGRRALAFERHAQLPAFSVAAAHPVCALDSTGDVVLLPTDPPRGAPLATRRLLALARLRPRIATDQPSHGAPGLVDAH